MIKLAKQIFCKHEYDNVLQLETHQRTGTKYISMTIYECVKCGKTITINRDLASQLPERVVLHENKKDQP